MPRLSVAIITALGLVLFVLVLVRPAPATPRPIPLQDKHPKPLDGGHEDDKPTITWTPSNVPETLFPGTSKPVTVHFRSSRSVSKVTVVVNTNLSGNDEGVETPTINQPAGTRKPTRFRFAYSL